MAQVAEARAIPGPLAQKPQRPWLGAAANAQPASGPDVIRALTSRANRRRRRARAWGRPAIPLAGLSIPVRGAAIHPAGLPAAKPVKSGTRPAAAQGGQGQRQALRLSQVGQSPGSAFRGFRVPAQRAPAAPGRQPARATKDISAMCLPMQ